MNNINNFEFLTKGFLKETISLRNGEIKIGEKCIYANSDNFEDILKNTSIKYVIFGISEDIGVQANFGRKGAKDMFKSFLKIFLNIQYNSFNEFNNIALLGNFQYNSYQEEADQLDLKNPKNRQRLFEMVSKIDQDVSKLCYQIIKHKKTPIIIGGGHNNCYGIIKGLSLGLSRPIDVLNFDTHSDFRILEGRHSGNGFSYAMNDGYLNKYYILGLHENYTSKDVLDKLKKNQSILTSTYEEIFIRESKSLYKTVDEIKVFFNEGKIGVEIDLDCLPNVMSSAFTPEGINLTDLRKYLHILQKHFTPIYLHICEGIPNMDLPGHTEKTISYILSDFIKNMNKN